LLSFLTEKAGKQHPRDKEPMNKRYNLICFGFMPWGNMWKRNQSMMAELSKSDFIEKLLFVNPRMSLKSTFHERVNPVYGEGTVRSIRPKPVGAKITVYTPMTWLPLKGLLPQLMGLEDYITLKIIQWLNGKRPYILFLNCPNFPSNRVLDELANEATLTLFDFSDDFPELGYDKKTREGFRRHSMKYAQKADVVLTVNEYIKEKYAQLNPNVHVIRNATNFENFNRSRFEPVARLEALRQGGNCIIGYSGIANLSRIDTNILDELIRHKPDWHFVFVGPAQSSFLNRYSGFENFHAWGAMKYTELPNVMRYFDVAIVPFLINDHTKGNDLLKLYDYLALGKPVVSTRIGGAEDLRGVIHLADTPSEFLREVETAMRLDNSKSVEVRKGVARANSWFKRIEEVKSVMLSALRQHTRSKAG
jgi:glycosyltransferase involved in cell wall biosynthesis